jgi:ATP-dependent HslUV protease ATP-binding subunit HslU
MTTESVSLNFSDDGIERIAEIASHINERTENIGARRLHTVMERLLETVSFEATDKPGSTLQINADYVNQQLDMLVKDEDLSRYIL